MAAKKQTRSKKKIKYLAEKEHDFLRGELVHLKDCQVKFLTFSVTATAVILGIIGRSSLMYSTGSKVPIGGMWLIPLAVLLPAWWIFFDKATTITRIVGYFRLLEKIILEETNVSNFPGWENALEEFRKKYTGGKFIDLKELFKILIFLTTHRYWVITYYIFFFLSLVCFIGSWKESNLLIIFFAGGLFLITTLWNARILWALIDGKYSFNNNAKRWEDILQIADK